MSNTLQIPTAELIGFCGSYFLLIMSPGPNFVLVSEAGLRSNRVQALLAALGVACGACCLYFAVAAGGRLVLEHELAKRLATILFGVYLISIALISLRSARNMNHGVLSARVAPTSRPFKIALVTAIGNPLSTMFFASSPFLVPFSRLTFLAAAAIFAIAASWFSAVALIASNRRLQSFLGQNRGRLDLAFAAVFLILGVTTIVKALP